MLNTCHPAPILTVSETGPGSSALICPPTSDTPPPASNHNGPANTTRNGDTLPHVVLVACIKNIIHPNTNKCGPKYSFIDSM